MKPQVDWDYSQWFEEWLAATDRVVQAARELNNAIQYLDQHRAILDREIDRREERHRE